MKVSKIKNRGMLFTYSTSSGWDLNIHLIMGDKYNYIIDTGLGTSSIDPIKDYIKHNNKPIIVVNTHHHWDHIWGNASLKDCIIISHKLCIEAIESKWDEMMLKYSQYCDGQAEKYLPNLVFEKELYFSEDKIRILYTPGHTIDSISVIDEKEKVINVGDNIGDTIDEIIPSIYCEKDLYIATLLKYKAMDFDTCVSGHNIVLGKEVVDRILNML